LIRQSRLFLLAKIDLNGINFSSHQISRGDSMKLACYLFSLILMLTFVVNCFSQKKDAPIEVKANILVLDSNKQPIDNVKQEDIKIFEDGVEQKITYFTKKEPILNLAMVFDNSGSFRKNLDEIIKAGKIITANLGDSDEAVVIRFVNNDKIEVVQNYTNNKVEIAEAIENLYIEAGQTALLDTVFLAAEKLLEREKNNSSKRYAILIFSDAEERDSFYKLDQVLEKFKGNDLQIFILSYANFAPTNKKLATKLSHLLPFETGGTTFMLPPKYKTDDLITFLKAIVYELRSQYIIGYTSTNQLRDGKPRKLTLNVADNEKGEKRQAFIREGFTVPKN
jgi:Ca-activated chloride channel homolog